MSISSIIAELSKLEPREGETDLYMHVGFYDDITGVRLYHKGGAEARKSEIDFFRMTQVYKTAPREKAAKDVSKVITTRRLGVNNGDSAQPNYRARLDGRERKCGSHARSVRSDASARVVALALFPVRQRLKQERAAQDDGHRHQECVLLRTRAQGRLHRDSHRRL